MKTDLQIQTDVIQELKRAAGVNEASIGVTVRNAIVTLTGRVPTYAEKSAAEKSAEKVKGVKAVVEQIEVRLPDEYTRDDHAIALAAVQALQWNTQVARDIKVEVENAWIKLTGTAEWEYERTNAVNVVKHLFGVAGVSNHISLISKVKTEEVKNKIQETLTRLAIEEAARIKVFATGGKVILSGTVRTFSERTDVELAAWAAPGVTEVKSELRVAVFG